MKLLKLKVFIFYKLGKDRELSFCHGVVSYTAADPRASRIRYLQTHLLAKCVS